MPKKVVCQISGYTSDLLTVNIPFGTQRKIPVVLHFEYAGFRGQTAPTGSFSAKTLPVGPANDFINRPLPLIHMCFVVIPTSTVL